MKNSTPDFNNSSPRGRLGGAVSLSERSGGAFKVLVIQQKMIGDVLTSSILFETLKEQYPSAELHYLIHKHTKPVVENNPFIDEFILFDPKKDSRFLNFISFLNYIRKADYDVVIDVYSKVNSAFITSATGAKIRVGQSKKYLDWAYTHSSHNLRKRNFKIPLAYENRLKMLQPIVNAINYKVEPKIYISAKEKQNLLKILNSQSLDVVGNKYIMVNILGSSEQKTYPLQYMARLLDEIVEENAEIKFLFNYIPNQIEEVKELKNFCSSKTVARITDFYAPSLREFIVLTSFCKLMIGNEGGAIHIAKALNIPSFAIFSPWVRKETWGISHDDFKNKNVHLIDFKPEFFTSKTTKALKEDLGSLYQKFEPELFVNQLQSFIQKNI